MWKRWKVFWYKYKVQNSVWEFLAYLNLERVKAEKDNRDLDMTIFGEDSVWEYPTSVPKAWGLRFYFKPFYFESGMVIQTYKIYLLDKNPEGMQGYTPQLSYKEHNIFKDGLEVTYDTPIHVFEALEARVEEWKTLLQKEIQRSKQARSLYLTSVLDNFPSKNSLLFEKIKVACVCGCELKITNADLELTSCSDCNTEYVLIRKEGEEPLLIDVMKNQVQRIRK